MSDGFIQASTVNPEPMPTFNSGEAGVEPESFTPSKIKPVPTTAGPEAGLPRRLSTLVPRRFEPSPSRGHHATIPSGGGAQPASAFGVPPAARNPHATAMALRQARL